MPKAKPTSSLHRLDQMLCSYFCENARHCLMSFESAVASAPALKESPRRRIEDSTRSENSRPRRNHPTHILAKRLAKLREDPLIDRLLGYIADPDATPANDPASDGNVADKALKRRKKSEPRYELLLSLDEMQLIESTVSALHTKESIPLPMWLVKQVSLSAGEIRRNISIDNADIWAKSSRRLIKRLSSDRLPMPDRLETVQELIVLARLNLEAMDRADLLPPPHGPFRTPTGDFIPAEEREQLARKPLTENDLKRIERLRAAIQKTKRKDGSHASPNVLIPEAHVGNSPGYRLLHLLADRGEYNWEFRFKS